MTDQTLPGPDPVLWNRLLKSVSDYMAGIYRGRDIPARLVESMEYSLLAGGKRLRPVLCLVSALACRQGETCAAPMERAVMPFASALEMIHTYSLIHDDLPAMDDDDLRRGRPTNHKAFDEATAILAGDALLTDAFQQMVSCPLPSERVLEAVRLASLAAGPGGMVGGQILDMEGEGQRLGPDALTDLNARKTGALIRTACECGAVLAGADAERREALSVYGSKVGMAFQITDDILDVIGDEASLGKNVGSDEEQDKSTWPSLLGLEAAKTLAAHHSRDAAQALSPRLFGSAEGDFLRSLALTLANRTH